MELGEAGDDGGEDQVEEQRQDQGQEERATEVEGVEDRQDEEPRQGDGAHPQGTR